MRVAALPALFLAAALAAPAAAQPVNLDDLARAARAAELADQNRRSEALNVEVNRRNAEVEARNAAARSAHERALADDQAARAAYEAELAKQAGDAAAAEADYARAMAAWKRRVAACKAGDVSQCEPTPPR